VVYRAVTTVHASGHRQGYLWLGLRGSATVKLNGETVAQLESQTRYRVGQFQFPVELRPGANRLEFDVTPLSGEATISSLLTGPRNNGDTIDGIRWQSV
jgi:hypothetical protein